MMPDHCPHRSEERPENDTKFLYTFISDSVWLFLSHKDSVLKFLFTKPPSSLTYFPYLY